MRKKQGALGMKLLAFALMLAAAVGIANIIVLQVGGKQPVGNSEEPSAPASQPEEEPEVMPGKEPLSEKFFQPGTEFEEQNVLRVEGTAVIIGVECRAIIAATTPERADAIDSGLKGTIPERPNAYDGWAAMLERFDITYEAATLYGVSESAGSYLSRAYFIFGSRVLDLDMRPSDAMALALRTGTPIFLNTTLLNETGRVVC